MPPAGVTGDGLSAGRIVDNRGKSNATATGRGSDGEMDRVDDSVNSRSCRDRAPSGMSYRMAAMTRWWRPSLTAVLLAVCASLAVAAPDAVSIQVVVNPAVQVEAISRNELRAIFSMRARQFRDGQTATVFILPDQSEQHRQFAKQTLQLLPYVLRDIWDQQVYTGTGRAPIVVNSKEEMLQRVAQTSGGIGYIVGNDNVTNEKVKTLSVR